MSREDSIKGFKSARIERSKAPWAYTTTYEEAIKHSSNGCYEFDDEGDELLERADEAVTYMGNIRRNLRHNQDE